MRKIAMHKNLKLKTAKYFGQEICGSVGFQSHDCRSESCGIEKSHEWHLAVVGRKIPHYNIKPDESSAMTQSRTDTMSILVVILAHVPFGFISSLIGSRCEAKFQILRPNLDPPDNFRLRKFIGRSRTKFSSATWHTNTNTQ